jgi:peptide/nickel transport system substrate-binding protein
MRTRVILCLAALLATLTGCTKISTSTGLSPNGAHSWTQPGVLRISDISDPSSLNPMLTGADIAYELSGYVLEYFVRLDDKGDLVPVLITQVPTLANGGVSKDGLTVTYHLRRGVMWSDGQPFGAQDVIETWKQVMNPDNPVVVREGYDDVKSIDAPDHSTVVVHLIRPYAPFPTRFFAGIQEGPIAPLPAHLIAGAKDLVRSPLNNKPVGTGPFMLESWEKNGQMIFVANMHYWGGEPKIKKIIFQARTDNTEIVSFRTHELDADIDATTNDLPSYRQLPDMNVVVSPSLRLSVLSMFTQSGPLSDVRLRRAIAYSVDRAELLQRIAHGAGYVADEFLPTWSWGFTKDVPHYDRDLAKAGALLDEAGWKMGQDGYRYKDGQRLTLLFVAVAGSDSSKHFAELTQQDLRAVGIDVTIKNYPYGVIFDVSGPIRQGKFNLTSYSYSVNYDPAALKDDGCDQFSPAGSNDSRLCDPEVDRAERRALLISDRAERKKLYADIERRRVDDLAVLPLWFRDRVGVLNADLHGYKPSRSIMANWNMTEWSIP